MICPPIANHPFARSSASFVAVRHRAELAAVMRRGMGDGVAP
jgi:hypothetical protein